MIPSNEIIDAIEASKTLSKDDFLEFYEKVRKSEIKELYFLVLRKLEKTILDNDEKKLECTCKILEYIHQVESSEALAECYKSNQNPFLKSDILVKASQHEQLAILEFLGKFTNLNELSIWTRGQTLICDDLGDNSHNAFYYAIRSGNVEILAALISVWRSLGIDARSLEDIISSSYRELKLRLVPLKFEMECYIMRYLLNMHSFSDVPEEVNQEKGSIEKIISRVNFVAENIELLINEYRSDDEDLDEKFLLIAKQIAMNIDVLKRSLKFSYNTLPWEEIEFCLYAYIVPFTKFSEMNLFYHAILTKDRLFSYLKVFSRKLKEMLQVKNMDLSKLQVLPTLSRNDVIHKVISLCPEFQELYDDYKEIRDVHSLNKMMECISHVSSADFKVKENQVIMIRCIQVIGENLKNSLESPKLSVATSELILLSLPKASRKILTDLRNSISHHFSLCKRIEIEQSSSDTFFEGLKTDLMQIEDVIQNILLKKKLKIIRMLLTKVIESSKIDDIKKNLKLLQFCQSEDMLKIGKNNRNKGLKQLVKSFSDIICDQTPFESILFEQVRELLLYAFTEADRDYTKGIAVITALHSSLYSFTDDASTLRGLKFKAKECIENFSNETEQTNYIKVITLLLKIFDSAYARTQNDDLKKLVLELCVDGNTKSDNLKWIEELKGELNGKQKYDNRVSPLKKHLSEYLKLKVSDLEEFLKRHNMESISAKNLSIFANKKEMLVIEMLVLDILTIIDATSNLPNNVYFLDQQVPILCGKSLRNHLAHDNYLFYLLITNPVISLVLNSQLLTTDAAEQNSYGTICKNNIMRFNCVFSEDIRNVSSQQKLKKLLGNGDLNAVKDCVSNGADINSIDHNSYSALHIASKASNLTVLKYIIHNSKITKEDSKRKDLVRNSRKAVIDRLLRYDEKMDFLPVHVAARYGRKDIVEFFIKERNIPVDSRDESFQTPLHHASINGHADTVSLLLNLKADVAAKDFDTNSPLLYALRNKHIAVVKLLLSENVYDDIDSAISPFTCLFVASEGGSLDIVKYLLKQNHKVNVRTDRGIIPLHVASLNGHLEVAKLLISNGSEVNARGIDGCTPLHYAVENDHLEVTRILVKNGADVKVFDKVYHNTPLHYAAKDGHKEIAEILIENKARLEARTNVGETPLHFSALEGHAEIVASLIQSGSEINARNIVGRTPLHLAALNGHVKVIDLLTGQNAIVNAQDMKGDTPLHAATSNNHLGAAERLISLGATVETFSFDGKSPLHYASENNHVDLVKCLVCNEANLDVKDNKGFTPLYWSATRGHASVAALLLEYKADIDAIEYTGMTPLHVACKNGNGSVVEVLLKNNADFSIKSYDLYSPMHYAAIGNDANCVQMLLHKGALTDAEDRFGRKPLFYAVKNNNMDIVKLLVYQGLKVDEELYFILCMAVTLGYKMITECLIKSCDVNKKIEDCTLLHLAAKQGHYGIVQCLLSQGANVNESATNCETPLYFAAQEGHEQIVETLLNHNASINVKNTEGLSPLFIASTQGHSKVVELLVKNGADAALKDIKNRSVIELAVAHGKMEVVRILAESGGVNLNVSGNDGFSVLHIAADNNSSEIIRYLVSKGCDINAENSSGSKPIHIAAREGFLDIVQFLLDSGSSINELGMRNQTVMHYAAMKGQSEVVQFLIIKEANVNARDDNGVTPIHLAACFCFKDVVKILLKNGAYYNIADNIGRKPTDMTENKSIVELFDSVKKLFDSIKNNNPSDIEKYIKAGAVIDCKNDRNEAPLHFAAWKGCVESVEILLKSKCNPDNLGKGGFTPIHYACKFSKQAVVEALLANGAKYDIPSESGKSPLDMATDVQIINLLSLLNELFTMAKKNNSVLVKKLQKLKCQKSSKFFEALMKARNKENRSLIELAICKKFSNIEQLEDIFEGKEPYLVKEAMSFGAKGDYQNGITLLKRELANREEILGANNPFCLNMKESIAQFIYKQGNYSDAQKILEEICKKWCELLGNDHERTLKSRSNIALTLHRLGENEKALKLFEQVYEKQKQKLGSDHDDSLETQIHMALVLDKLERFQEAFSHNQFVYEKQRKKNNPKAVLALNNVAMVLTNQNKTSEALEVYKDVLKLKQLYFGHEHPETLRTLHNIAGVLLMQKKYSDAVVILKDILKSQQKTLGPVHPDTLNTQSKIADAYFDQGKWVAAYKALKEVLDLQKSSSRTLNPMFASLSFKFELVKERFKMENRSESEMEYLIRQDIIIAAGDGDLMSVEALLKDGINVNERDVEGRIPLHFAANSNDFALAKLLMGHGADPSLVTNKGNTPLHTAVTKNHKDVADLILKHSLSTSVNKFINAVTFKGRNSALHVAAKNGNFSIVLLLLQHGAIYNSKNSEGHTPVDASSDERVFNFLRLIENLFEYAKNGNPKIIEKIKCLGREKISAIANVRNSLEYTLVQVLLSKKHKSIASQLICLLKSV